MINEREIISRIVKGDKKAFSLLVNEYQKLIFHVAKRMIQNNGDVEDVCQEVFIKIYRNIRSFAYKSKLSTWIARITYLTSINYLKMHRKHEISDFPEDLEECLADYHTPEDILNHRDMSQYLQMLITELPVHYGLVLTLFHLQEFSLQEIQGITGMPEGTIKNYLFRARILLKEKVKLYLVNDHERR
ncbi:RNA polymerase sigma factor [Pedobacter sp. WC2423]|uniref:RNA polymerase sigma factor n=1 Tax=Pedobacter sp. WC2423 TaxID=3234142 RepID=UPI0034660331